MSINFDSPIERNFCGSIPDEAEAKCEHKHTYSYSEVSELGAVAKSGTRKCVACGAEIDVRSAELPEPQPSAQSVELPPLDVTDGDISHAKRLVNEMPPEWSEEEFEGLTDFGIAERVASYRYCRERQLLAALTENASLRQQLAAEREAHEVTKKALEMACEHDTWSSQHYIAAVQSSASSPSQEGL